MLNVRPDHTIKLSARTAAGFILLLLVGSLACVAIAPLLMPDSYSPIANAVSESAAQGVENAWVARLGFLMLGFAVLLSATLAGVRWSIWGRLAFRLYGIAMIAVAAFAHSPWEDVPFDQFEDSLHSFAASSMGLFFTIGVLVVTFRRGPGERWARWFDWLAVLAAPVIPMIMFNVTGIAGLMQRIMFLIAYVWYGMEAILSARAAERESTSVLGSDELQAVQMTGTQ